MNRKKLANVGSNAVQGQPSHLQVTVMILQIFLKASDDVSTCVVIFWRGRLLCRWCCRCGRGG